MAMLTPNSPLVISGAAAALFVRQAGVSIEMPMTKATVKINAEKTEVTGSTSVATAANGRKKIWKEYGEGASGYSANFQTYWRVDQVIQPMELSQGEVYNFFICTRRPGWENGGDAGAYYDADLYIDDKEMSMEPKSGVLEWSVSTTGQGYLDEPTD